MKGNGVITLFDVNQVEDSNTGYRDQWSISNKITIRCEINDVGSNTYWNASSEGTRLDNTFIIKRVSYNKEKYLKHGKSIYKIFNTGKAQHDSDIKLNCTEIPKSEIGGVSDGL